MESTSYLEKITSAHISRPRYMAWLKALLDMLCTYGTLTESMAAAFFVDNAYGAQLDAIGAQVGANRHIAGLSTDVLSDADYRSYIKAKILCNMWDGTNASLPELWNTVYPSLQMNFVDGMDMTMTVTVTGDISTALSQMIQTGMIIPCPSGVGQTFIVNTTTIEPAEVEIGTGLYEFGNDEFFNQE